MTSDPRVETFWKRYLTISKNQAAPSRPPEAWSFGDNPVLADKLCHLVLAGIKTATSSLLWEYEDDQAAIPQEGQLSIILDGQGKPCAVIETTQVFIQPFNQVGADFAFEEGEDDRSLESWRKEHWQYYTRISQGKTWKISEDMPLVCERFRLLYQNDER